MNAHRSITDDTVFGFHVRCRGCGGDAFVQEGTITSDGSAVVTRDSAAKWFRKLGWGWQRGAGYWCSEDCKKLVQEAAAQQAPS